MKVLLKINVTLQDEVIVTHKIINNTDSLYQSSKFKADDDVSSFLFVKDLVKHKDFRSESSIMNLIKHVKETQITDYYNRMIKLINMNIEDSSNVQYQKLQIDDSILK